MILYFLFGFFAYLLAGLGLGGGALLIPCLTEIAGMSQSEAQYISLICYIPAASAVTVSNRKKCDISAVRLIPAALAGALLGASFLQSGIHLKRLYSLFLTGFGIYMLISALKNTSAK